MVEDNFHKIDDSYNLVIPLLGIYPNNMKTLTEKKKRTLTEKDRGAWVA